MRWHSACHTARHERLHRQRKEAIIWWWIFKAPPEWYTLGPARKITRGGEFLLHIMTIFSLRISPCAHQESRLIRYDEVESSSYTLFDGRYWYDTWEIFDYAECDIRDDIKFGHGLKKHIDSDVWMQSDEKRILVVGGYHADIEFKFPHASTRFHFRATMPFALIWLAYLASFSHTALPLQKC